jgi:hypothetical protein
VERAAADVLAITRWSIARGGGAAGTGAAATRQRCQPVPIGPPREIDDKAGEPVVTEMNEAPAGRHRSWAPRPPPRCTAVRYGDLLRPGGEGLLPNMHSGRACLDPLFPSPERSVELAPACEVRDPLI